MKEVQIILWIIIIICNITVITLAAINIHNINKTLNEIHRFNRPRIHKEKSEK